MKTTRVLFAVAALLVFCGPPAWGAIGEADLETLRAELRALTGRVATLEADNARLRERVASSADSVPVERLGLVANRPGKTAGISADDGSGGAVHWSERVSIDGDFRYRYEEIHVDDAGVRERDRIRVRLNVKARLSPEVTVGAGLATGGNDPVSTNQTLGEVGSPKEVRLNLAYVGWQPLEGLSLHAGKMINPFYRPQSSSLLWDGDYTPEGIGGRWEGRHLFATAAGNWLESDNRQGGKVFAWGLQGGVRLALGGAELTLGTGYFELPVAGRSVFFSDGDEFYGNSYRCANATAQQDCAYLYDYEEWEGFAHVATTWAKRPLQFYLDVVQNQAVDEFDTGWLAGIRYGSARAPGTWWLGYEYQDLEADAVFGLLSDSDFAGGGADGKGHKLAGDFALTDNISLGFTWYINNKVGENLFGSERQYDRVILDANFSY
ncbi:MAG: putative porin [Parahaliea sp.]